MKFKWPILFLFCIASASAQTYRWVDAQGRVTYSDKPPPAPLKADKKSLTTGDVNKEGLSYALSEAVNNFPVTLYTSSDCTPCDDGRALLKKRGIPFSERTVSNDEDAKMLKQAGGSRLPHLVIGRNDHNGFEADAWNMALTAAGYPETSQLPPGFQYPPAQKAAPPPPPLTLPQNTEPSRPASAPPPAQGTTIPDFRF